MVMSSRSAFEKPGEWGAKKGADEDVAYSVESLGLNTRIRSKLMKVEDVERILADINYQFER